MKKLGLILLGVLTMLPTFALDFEYRYSGQTVKYTVLDEEAKTCEVGFDEAFDFTGDLILPANPKYNNIEYTLTTIGEEAFSGCSGLTSVTIPNSVTTIGSEAFSGCSGLTSVTIGNSVESIGSYAFSGCSGLTSVTIGNSVTTIGKNAFSNCSGLTKAEFSSIEHLCSINFGNVYANPLFYAHNLYINGEKVKEVVIPETVTSIGSYAFEGCSGLTSVTIGNSVTSIGENAFSDCIGLTKAEFSSIEHLCSINFGNVYANPLSYAHNLYINGEEVKDLVIPEAVTTIGNYTFYRCSGLTSVTIGNSVTSIGGYTFYRCSGLTSVTIPNSVTTIGNYTFSGCSGLTSVTIGNSVTTIGNYTFSGCSGLTSVTIPNSVTTIGSDAFSGCSGLTSVTIGNSVTTIGNYTFSGCSGLTSVTIPNSVTTIGSDAFSGCSGLTSVTIGNSVESIGGYAFSGCSGLTSVTIPNSVTTIGSEAFSGCSGLTSVTIGNSVESIGSYAFSGCSGLTSVTIPNSVTTIGNYTFSGCSGLTSVTIGNSVTSIGSYAFEGCSGLTSVTIGNSVESIGSYSFSGCSGLTSVTIPNSVTTIGSEAFSGCSGLENLYSLAKIPPKINETSFTGLYDTIKLEVPTESLAEYLATPWSLFKSLYQSGGEDAIISYNDGLLNYCLIPASSDEEKNIAIVISGNYSGDISIPERFTYIDSENTPQRYYVEGIGYKAFQNSSVNTISFNSRIDLKSIGDYAFAGSSLSSIIIPSTVTSIGSDAFSGCRGLTSVTIGNSVTSIGSWAFRNCSGLTKAEFSSIEHLCSINFGSVYANPLSYAHNLYINGEEVKEVVIPETVTSIGSYAFEDCSGLTSVTIPNSVTTIGSDAFSGCSGLTSVTIGNSVTSIGSWAFRNCSGLTKAEFSSIEHLCSINFGNVYANPLSYAHNLYINGEEVKEVVIPETVTSIGSYAFEGCSGLTSVTIPNSVTTIGNYTFSGCSGLTSVTIGNSVESIGSYAFEGCSGLTSVTIPNSVTTIGNYTFSGCSRLTSVTIGNSVESIGGYAFSGCSGLTSVTIPNSVTTIGNYTFSGCSGLTSLSLADGVIPFNDSNKVFAGMNLKTLYIGRPLETQTLNIGNLESLSIGNTITEIAPSMWSDATKLTSLTLGNSLTAIGENAFSGCTALTEVVVPPSVETIGASAFAGNTAIETIIMGHNVKTIGEKAFDGCPASTVSITAQTPPTASNNTFSNYSGKLYLQGQEALDAYYDAFTCWDRFDSYVMVEPTEIQYTGENKLTGKPGDTFQLNATLMPENVTLPQVFWRSTNPEIATVDANGLVTLHADTGEVMSVAETDDESVRSCKIIAESLYSDGPMLEVTVSDVETGIDEIMTDGVIPGTVIFNDSVEVYNMNGLKVSNSTDNLAPGIYIVRQGKSVKKIAVK